MYSGVGPPFKEILGRKNEWCKYDPILIVDRLKTIANGLIAIAIIGWVIPPTILAYYVSSYSFLTNWTSSHVGLLSCGFLKRAAG